MRTCTAATSRGGGAGGTAICLCLAERTLAAALGELERNRGVVDLAELRADSLSHAELGGVPSFCRAAGVPLVLAFRRASDGGSWRGTEEERSAALLRALRDGEFAYVELEEGFDPPGVREACARRGTRIIRSRHVPDGLPADLGGALASLGAEASEIPKLAVTPRGSRDLLALVSAAKSTPPPPAGRILCGMGEFGLATGILAARVGSLLAYCFPLADPAVPGRPTARELRELYRFGSIRASTVLFAVAGNPVAHSLSPHIHNRGLAAAGVDAVYVPFLVDDVPAFLEAAVLLGTRGVSVTIPHKLSVIPFLSRRDPSVERIGACNTLVREPSGWFGTNTDWIGFLRALERGSGLRPDGDTRATVLGAGGGAWAVVYALRSRGCSVLVLNRDARRAQALAGEFGCSSAPLGSEGEGRIASHADLIVQCTSCGMDPLRDCDPIEGYRFRGSEVLFELVYRPELTLLAARARDAGCLTVGGIEMLLEQAYEQFRLFTGAEYPRELRGAAFLEPPAGL